MRADGLERSSRPSQRYEPRVNVSGLAGMGCLAAALTHPLQLCRDADAVEGSVTAL